MKTAIVSGTFDPITVGHFDVIKRASMLFDRVVVAVSSNSAKSGMFDSETRLEAVRASVKDLKNVEAELCEGLLAEFCMKYESPVLVRGVRVGSDFDYERSLYLINKGLGVVETVILPAASGLDHVSSTYAREMIKYNKSLEGIVPEAARAVIEK